MRNRRKRSYNNKIAARDRRRKRRKRRNRVPASNIWCEEPERRKHWMKFFDKRISVAERIHIWRIIKHLLIFIMKKRQWNRRKVEDILSCTKQRLVHHISCALLLQPLFNRNRNIQPWSICVCVCSLTNTSNKTGHRKDERHTLWFT